MSDVKAQPQSKPLLTNPYSGGYTPAPASGYAPYYQPPAPQYVGQTSQQQQNNVVVVAPQPPVVTTTLPPEDNFLTLSIILTIACIVLGGWLSMLCTISAIAMALAFGYNSKRQKPGKHPTSEPQVDLVLEEKLKEIEQLSETQINERVVAMLEDTNVAGETARQHILRQSIKDKKRLLQGWVQRDYRPSGVKDGGPSTPEEFVDELRKFDFTMDSAIEGYHSTMDRLRVSLSTNGLSWVKNFGEKEGLEALLNILHLCAQESYQGRNAMLRKIQHTCVRCLKAFMNNKYGLGQVLQSEDAIITFVTAMDPYNENMMSDVLKVTAAVCLVADGYDKVMEAVTVNGDQCGIRRFDPVLTALKKTSNPALQLACMQFINAIVNSPDDLDFRIHLRNEFMRGGLGEVSEVLRGIERQDLKTHLEIFDNHMENDFEEILHRFQDIETEFNEPDSVFNLLLLSIQGTSAAPYLLSILQHLLLIREDFFDILQYYKLIDSCVTQIVLHKNGIDPDFSYQKFNIDVDNLIEGLVDKARVEEAEKLATDLEQQLRKEEAIRNETESKLHATNEMLETNQKRFDQTLTERDNEIRQLKDELTRRPTIIVADPNAAGGGPQPPPPLLPGPGGAPSPSPDPGGALPPPPPGGSPPPLPGPGIPPPPPGLGGPPPPPGMGQSVEMKEKKKYKVNIQMRRMNWNKIQKQQLNANSFWAQANEEALESTDLFAEIESTFGTGKEKVLGEVENPRLKLPKLKQLKVLDPNSAQNILIMLGTLRMNYEDVRDMVLSVENERMSEQMIQQLLKYMPTKEQMTQLLAYKDKRSELAEAEQFVVVMSDVKRLPERLECMLCRVRFEEERKELQDSVTSVIAACREIRTSKKFEILLEVVLLMGNYMNAGSRNAQSFGFELSYLTKLNSTKSADQKTTLLHFLESTVEKRFPDVLTFGEELRSCEGASRVSEEAIRKGVSQMDAGINKMKEEIKMHDKPQGADRFPQRMKEFVAVAEDKYKKLKDDYELLEQKFDELANFYCFDKKKTTMEEFFGDISTFVKDFERAQKENEKMREQLEKQRQQKEKEEKAKQQKTLKRAKSTCTNVIDLSSGGDEEGVLDKLLQNLQTGDAFQVPRGKRTGPGQAAKKKQKDKTLLMKERQRSRVGGGLKVSGDPQESLLSDSQPSDSQPSALSRYSSDQGAMRSPVSGGNQAMARGDSTDGSKPSSRAKQILEFSR